MYTTPTSDQRWLVMLMLRQMPRCLLGIALAFALSACDGSNAPNNPHTDFNNEDNIRFGVFTESPKTLDPARSYSADEIRFTAQILEPPLQYDLMARPYQLIPLTAQEMPTVTHYDKQNKPIKPNTDTNADVAYTLIDIYLKPGIYYAPHPAFAQSKDGEYVYHAPPNTAQKQQAHAPLVRMDAFAQRNTRELTAHDYVYQIKRLANPAVRSPIYGIMQEHIHGLRDLNQRLQAEHTKRRAGDATLGAAYLDLRQFELSGVKVFDEHHYQIKINKHYAPFMYWLAMTFFAPTPWEVDRFYSQAEQRDNNLTFDTFPVGTGAYQLIENNPNARMVLTRNPNYMRPPTPHPVTHAPVRLPRIDKHVYTLEKESIPQWTKFMQGYYDTSGISADSFDQAVQINADGTLHLTPLLRERGIHLSTTVEPTLYYLGFNMKDSVVGGESTRARKLRHAISHVIDYDEYISIFLNGRGIKAHGPLPPGIFGYQPQPATHTHTYAAQLKRAQQLLVEAGYPNGRNPNTGQPLILNYDVSASAGPEEKAVLNWMRKQFAKIGIELHVRATQYNRFQEKIRTGRTQLYALGWSADYPDPENFLFLFYGPNAKVPHGGENASNYNNAHYDRLFEAMRNLPNTPRRAQLIKRMLALLEQDAPWVWGFHPKRFELSHAWVEPFPDNAFANNTLQYRALDPAKRQQLVQQWNQPTIWPAIVITLILFIFFIPVFWQLYRKQHRPNITRIDQ